MTGRREYMRLVCQDLNRSPRPAWWWGAIGIRNQATRSRCGTIARVAGRAAPPLGPPEPEPGVLILKRVVDRHAAPGGQDLDLAELLRRARGERLLDREGGRRVVIALSRRIRSSPIIPRSLGRPPSC